MISTNISTSPLQDKKLKQDFEENGYLVLNNFVSLDDCSKLISEQHNIINNLDVNNNIVIFNTDTQEHAATEYFLNSARNISFFYEKDSININTKQFKVPINKAINKIGHALHDLNPVFQKFSYNIKFKELVVNLGIKKPSIVQSMYLLKQPKIGNKVDIHQDSSFIYTEPESCIGLWFALENANINNGCLWAIPGSHHGVLKQRLYRKNNSTHMEILDYSDYDLSKGIPLEVKAGALVVLHGRLAHYSNYNHSDKSRHAYALHIVDHNCQYSKNNWLQDYNSNINYNLPFKLM